MHLIALAEELSYHEVPVAGVWRQTDDVFVEVRLSEFCRPSHFLE